MNDFDPPDAPTSEQEHDAREALSSNPQCDNPQHYLIYADGQRDDSCVYCQVERLTAELEEQRKFYQHALVRDSDAHTAAYSACAAERDRLRAALDEAADLFSTERKTYPDWHERSQAWLKRYRGADEPLECGCPSHHEHGPLGAAGCPICNPKGS